MQAHRMAHAHTCIAQGCSVLFWYICGLFYVCKLSSSSSFVPTQEWAVTNNSRVGSGGGAKRLAEPPDMEDLSLDREKSPPQFTPEYLTLCGKDGSTYQLSVEGSKIKNLTQTPLHVSLEGGEVGGCRGRESGKV